MIITYIILGAIAVLGLSGIRIVSPDERAAIKRLGKYLRPANEGFNWIIPVIDSIDSALNRYKKLKNTNK